MVDLENWQRNHAIVGSIAVFVFTVLLWVKTGMSLREALDSSMVDFAVMFYGAIAGLFEGGGMFYAIAQIAKARREAREAVATATAEVASANAAADLRANKRFANAIALLPPEMKAEVEARWNVNGNGTQA